MSAGQQIHPSRTEQKDIVSVMIEAKSEIHDLRTHITILEAKIYAYESTIAAFSVAADKRTSGISSMGEPRRLYNNIEHELQKVIDHTIENRGKQ